MPTESPHSAAVTLGWWQQGPDTEYTAAFTDPKPPTLSVCPQCHRSPSVCGILGRFLQAAASRHAGSQEFLVQCCCHPASPGHPVTTITHPASLRQRVSSCCCSPPAPATRTQARGDQRIDTTILLMQLLLKCSFKVTWNGQREIRDGFELCNVTMWHLCPQHPPAPTGPPPGLLLLLQPLTVPSQGTCRMGHPKGLSGAKKGTWRAIQCQMTQHASKIAKNEQHKQQVAPSHLTLGHQPTQILELPKTSWGCAFMLCKVIWEPNAWLRSLALGGRGS